MNITSNPDVIMKDEEFEDELEEYESDSEISNEDIGDESMQESEEENKEFSDENDYEHKNLSWADAVNKIFKTKSPKDTDTIVLSKAKKLTQIKSSVEKPAGFEVQLEDGKIKQETVKVEIKKKETNRKKRRRNDLPTLRKKPNVLEKDREKLLSKIATKGVVQLFNAVKSQQQQIKNQLNEVTLVTKKESILKNIDKNTFLDKLMSEKSENVEEAVKKHFPKQLEKETETKEKLWSVLRDDFMMGAKLKDWDKELEVENENNLEINYESD